MAKRRIISRPIPNSATNDLLSYYVFYKDKPTVGCLGGTPTTLGNQKLQYMSGVVFADKAKYEILQLRSQNDFLEKENQALQDRLVEYFKKEYGID
jgi:hypothetical protein